MISEDEWAPIDRLRACLAEWSSDESNDEWMIYVVKGDLRKAMAVVDAAFGLRRHSYPVPAETLLKYPNWGQFAEALDALHTI